MHRTALSLIACLAFLPSCLDYGSSDDDDDDDETSEDDDDDGDSSSSDTDETHEAWQEAIEGYQFTYYYTVTDYSERISFVFCSTGDVSYSWSISSSGSSGSYADGGSEDGTWELGDTTSSAAVIELDGDDSGRVDVILSVNSSNEFFIDDARYYREWYGC